MNKTVFITGSTKNVGRAIAEKFAKEGYNVAVSSRTLDDAVQYAEELSKKYNIKSAGYKLEISDVSQIEAVFRRIYEDFGSLDTFVANSAQLGLHQTFENITEEDFDSLMDVNIKGTFFCCQNAAKYMRKGGSIVVISSVQSKRCVTDRCLYSISKAAVNMLVKDMCVELGERGIRANTLIAGGIRTDRWENFSDEKMALMRSNWPLGTESTGEDIANGVFFLGTDLSRTVSGTELTVDSGLLAQMLPQNRRYK